MANNNLDKVAGGGLYYSYIERLDKLKFASINDQTFAVNYEFEIVLPLSATAPWLSITVDELGSNGYAYVYIATNLQDNLMLMFKKSDGSINSFVK